MKMEVERRGSRGGFLHLFDWSGKSRKKLISNKSETPEGLKQGEENVDDSTRQMHLMVADENETSSSVKGASDCNCSSSVTSEEGYGNRVPGVIARLMGLDSLPISHVPNSSPISTPFEDPPSINDSQYHALNEMNEYFRNSIEPKPQKKVQRPPIEKFQTEKLPPKSTKSIRNAHHKQSPPIKSSSFIAAKNVNYIIENPPNHIEPVTCRIPSIGSSAVSVKIRTPNKKIETSSKVSKRKASSDSGKGSSSMTMKNDRLNSLPQRKNGLNSSNSTSFINPKEPNRAKPKQDTSVLKSNTQKQNSISNRQTRKSQSTKTSETGSRKVGPVQKELPLPKTKYAPRRKQSYFDETDRNERFIQRGVARDGFVNWKKGMDIVSFTFTSPINKATAESTRSSCEVSCVDSYSDSVSTNDPEISSLGLNEICGDALNVLLEEKIKELTNKVDFSHPNRVNAESDCSSINGSELETKRKFEVVGEMEGHSNCSNDNELWNGPDYQHPCPVKMLEPFCSYGSCSLSENRNNCFTTGTNQCMPSRSQDEMNSNTTQGPYPIEPDTNLSAKSTNWEVDYIRDILFETEFMSDDYMLNQTQEITSPTLFDQFENQKSRNEPNGEEDHSKIERKVLFDCVIECANSRNPRLFGGTFRKKDLLVDEFYKEILGWESMRKLMVDDVVEKDMSSCYGKWVDFEKEVFEESVEIEYWVMGCLVDELVDDLLFI